MGTSVDPEMALEDQITFDRRQLAFTHWPLSNQFQRRAWIVFRTAEIEGQLSQICVLTESGKQSVRNPRNRSVNGIEKLCG